MGKGQEVAEQSTKSAPAFQLDEVEQGIYNLLDQDVGTSVDDVMRAATNLPINIVLATLTKLVLKNAATKLPTGSYKRNGAITSNFVKVLAAKFDPPEVSRADGLDGNLKIVYAALETRPQTVDEIFAKASGLGIAEVLATLTKLVLTNYAAKTPLNLYFIKP